MIITEVFKKAIEEALREKIAIQLFDRDNRLSHNVFRTVKWETLAEANKDLFRRDADQILTPILDELFSITAENKGHTYKLGIVQLDGELPIRHGKDLVITRCDKCNHENLIDSYSQNVGISDMLKAGYKKVIEDE